MDGYNIRQVIVRFKIDMAQYPHQLKLAEDAEIELRQLEEAAQQKMHPALGESAASNSESNPAPKPVI